MKKNRGGYRACVEAKNGDENQPNPKPSNSLLEEILVRAPPGLPLLGPSPHRGSRCGVGLVGGGLGRGALPHH